MPTQCVDALMTMTQPFACVHDFSSVVHHKHPGMLILVHSGIHVVKSVRPQKCQANDTLLD